MTHWNSEETIQQQITGSNKGQKIVKFQEKKKKKVAHECSKKVFKFDQKLSKSVDKLNVK